MPDPVTSPPEIELDTPVLDRHDRISADLRRRFDAAGTLAVNLISSPGTGKTALLTEVLAELVRRGHTTAALVGDCATDNDARRLAASGAPVRQIVTEGMCHLEVTMIDAHVQGWDLNDIDVLFIENVGNLVCPAAFDLGETARIVMMSVTEGEDKPLKYPQMFSTADLVIITKIDLAEPCDFDRDAAHAAIRRVNPSVPILETTVKDPATIDALVDWLPDRIVS